MRRESTRLVPNDLGRVFGHYGVDFRAVLFIAPGVYVLGVAALIVIPDRTAPR